MISIQKSHEYYLALLNKIAEISPIVAESDNFVNYVVAAYDEHGDPALDIGHVPLLHMFLVQVKEIASEKEFDEMMKGYDLNKIYNSNLFEIIECLYIVNGILIDNREEV